jgi:glycosyltransferase involved in cell wall biosynthesis
MSQTLSNAVRRPPQQGTQLRVSIVMPVRNERRFLAQSLTDLSSQDYPGIAEILVVDGMSQDGTRDIAAAFAARDARIQLIDNPKRGVSAALNIGIGRSTGEVIVRADCHASYARDYVSRCVECLIETGAANVGGPALPHSNRGTVMERAIVAAHESCFGVGVARFRRPGYEGPADTVWPGAFLRSVIAQTGGFREDLDRTEDIDFNARLRQAGYRAFLTPRIRVRYVPRDGLISLCAQNFANGRGIAQTLLVNPRAVRLRHLIPAGFVVSLACAGLAAGLTGVGPLPLWAILAPYGAAALSASACAAARHGVAAAALPAVFTCLHLSYGLGTLCGCMRELAKGVAKLWR